LADVVHQVGARVQGAAHAHICALVLKTQRNSRQHAGDTLVAGGPPHRSNDVVQLDALLRAVARVDVDQAQPLVEACTRSQSKIVQAYRLKQTGRCALC
jgi:hypothetical protein